MKKTILLFAILFIANILNAQVEPPLNNNWYEISTLDELRWISENPESWDKDIQLMNDIDAADTKNWNAGKGFLPIGRSRDTIYVGIFKGNNFHISNLYINRPKQDYIGLFGFIWGGIINFKLEQCTIVGQNNVGSIFGSGISSIINSSSNGSVTGKTNVGGFVGHVYRGCCISNCFSLCSVSGIDTVGGFIGREYKSTTFNCFSTGLVSGKTNIGGFTGISSGIVVNCFWDIENSTVSISSSGKGRTSNKMKSLQTYTKAGWNFDFIWKIKQGYPYISIDTSYRPLDTDGNGFINISTLIDLLWLSESGYDFGEKYELDNNINAADTKYWNGGLGFSPIGSFVCLYIPAYTLPSGRRSLDCTHILVHSVNPHLFFQNHKATYTY